MGQRQARVSLVLKGDGPWRDALVTDSAVSTLRQESATRQQKLDEFVGAQGPH